MKLFLRTTLVCLLVGAGAVTVDAYRDDTHRRLAALAFDAAAQTIERNFFAALGLGRGDNFVGAGGMPCTGAGPQQAWTARTWVIEAAQLEDHDCLKDSGVVPLLPPLLQAEWDATRNDHRALFHFFEPGDNLGLNGAKLTFISILGYISNATTSRGWALDGLGVVDMRTSPSDGQPHVAQASNLFSYDSARHYQLSGLVSASATTRNQATALMFAALGHVIHLIQDSAQPQHVRNDIHTDVPVLGNKSAYEYLVEGQLDSVLPWSTAVTPTYPGHAFARPSDFFADGTGAGIAEFTNKNFVSANTNCTVPTNGTPLVGACSSRKLPSDVYPLPQIDVVQTGRPVDLLYGGSLSQCLADLVGVNAALANAYCTAVYDFVGNRLGDPLNPTSFAINPAMASHTLGLGFGLTRFSYIRQARILLPRAAAYSAGLLNYFFRDSIDGSIASSGELTIRNVSTDALSGQFSLYYDATDGSRRVVPGATWDAVSLGAGAGTARTFVAPTDAAAAGVYLLVFTGSLGGESDTVAGRRLVRQHGLVHLTIQGSGTVTSSPQGIECSAGTCSASFPLGAPVTLTASPSGAFQIWSGACSGTSATTTVTPTADTTCTATMAGGTQINTLSVAVTGNGSVVSLPSGISCFSGTCTGSFAAGSNVTLSAEPVASFQGWGGQCTGTGAATTVSLVGNKSCTAAFAGGTAARLLTVTVNGSGSVSSMPSGISCSSGTCTASFPTGSSVTLTASGVNFQAWGDRCAGTSAATTLVLDADSSCVATFGAPQPPGPTMPGSVSGVSLQSGSVTVSWQDRSNDETRFEIAQDESISVVRTLAANTVSTTFTGLNPTTTYKFYVRACGAIACSGWGGPTTIVPSGPTPVTYPCLCTTPTRIAVDSTYVWTANYSTNNVTRLRKIDGQTTTFRSGGNGSHAIVSDGANVWVSNVESRTLTKMSPDGATLFTRSTNGSAYWLAYDGANVWTSNNTVERAMKFRGSDGAVLGTFATGGMATGGVAFDGTNVWVGNGPSGTVARLRASDGALLGTVATGANVMGVAFDGTYIWTANRGSNTVSKIRASDAVLLGTFSSGGIDPYGITSDGTRVWVTNYAGNTVGMIRVSDGALETSLPFPGAQPNGVAFDGRRLWVAGEGSHTITTWEMAAAPPAGPAPPAGTPVISAVGCTPTSAQTGEAVSCTPSVSVPNGESVTAYTWQSSGSAASGSASSFTTTFAAAGLHLIQLTACNNTACAVQAQTIQVQGTTSAPVINALGCSPSTGNTGQTISCNPAIAFPNGGSASSYSWVGGGTPATGSNATFATSYGGPGAHLIQLTVCNGATCSVRADAVHINQATSPPVISGVGCSPTSVAAGSSVLCNPSILGTVTSYAWTGGGTPAGGQGSTFSTAYASAGTRLIQLVACNAAACTVRAQSLAVTGGSALPAINSLGCPNGTNVGVTVTCSAAATGATSLTWQSSGTPASGSGTTFSTRFLSNAWHTVQLRACSPAGCTVRATTIVVN